MNELIINQVKEFYTVDISIHSLLLLFFKNILKRARISLEKGISSDSKKPFKKHKTLEYILRFNSFKFIIL